MADLIHRAAPAVNVSHRVLARLERGYSIALIPGRPGEDPAVLAGSEAEDRLLYFEPPEYRPKVIAREPGGYISIWPLVHGERRFVIATTRFKPGFNGADAAIRLYPLDGVECPASTWIADMPYTHRIALLPGGWPPVLLISTLCAAKSHKEDWTQPGGIHLAEMPADQAVPWPVRQIVRGLNKNHGLEYAELGPERRPGYLLSAMEGLFFLPIPEDPHGDWRTEQIATEETSDAFAFDWDGDGEPEIFSISPFHGNVLAMHRRTPAGWQRVVIHDDLALGHIVWAGELLGGPALLAGSRRERRELRLYRPAASGGIDPKYQVIDDGIGPSQIAVWPIAPDRARLYVAAHGVDEVRIYEVFAGAKT